jgi:ADP-ribose pyrophosphatase YjhB (NUDIX family)
VVAVGVIIQDGPRLVLVQRDKDPSRDLWTFPGGAVELGESLHEAARREAWEETNLQVEIGQVATVIDHVVRDEAGRVQYHYVIVDYMARPVGGALRASTDVRDACWFGLEDLEALPMTEKAGQLARHLLAQAGNPASSSEASV